MNMNDIKAGPKTQVTRVDGNQLEASIRMTRAQFLLLLATVIFGFLSTFSMYTVVTNRYAYLWLAPGTYGASQYGKMSYNS